ncbi:MAG: glycosyltransferase family 2 protein [Candidatus Lokiarchaeota archaeon]|nr:glycosyltransferase family 2 protein [Candidatus Lokiarchaeota archaeon]
MNHKPKISVIIPTYNEENNIKKTLIAIERQKCDIPYEIIIADGQSSDNTVFIAKKSAKVYISPKKGKAFQLNYVIPKTSGELLIFLDADMIINPYFFQKIYKIFKNHQNLYACSARVKYHNGKAISFKLASQRFTITQYFFLNINIHLYYLLKTLLGFPELSGCNMIVRRDIFLKTGGFKSPPNSLGIDKVFSDSLIYLIRKMKKGKIKTLSFVSVLTSGRNLNIKRSLKRISQYFSKKDIYYELAKKIN